MAPEGSLTKRDEEILRILTKRVRVVSVAQLGRVFWGKTKHPEHNAERRLTILVGMGLVYRQSVFARPVFTLKNPVVTWTPGEEEPKFGSVSYHLKSRWNKIMPKAIRVVLASQRAANYYRGYGGQVPRDTECTHDLHLAEVYLKMRIEDPKRARTWVSEAEIKKGSPRSGGKLPDAMVQVGTRQTVIECGGLYKADKLMAFHEYCNQHGLAYEIW